MGVGLGRTFSSRVNGARGIGIMMCFVYGSPPDFLVFGTRDDGGAKKKGPLPLEALSG